MAERAQKAGRRTALPAARTLGAAIQTARQQLAWVWTRESLLRLLLSFVLAIALWLYVTGKQNPSQIQDYAVPLQISTAGLSSNLAVSQVLAARITTLADTWYSIISSLLI